MDKLIVRAYLWQEVIRLGFSPTSASERQTWLHLYSRSLYKFWEMQSYPEMPKKSDNAFRVTIYSPVDISFECEILQGRSFSVRFLHGDRLMWLQDADKERYFTFPKQLLLTKHNKSRQAIAAMEPEDMSTVLDSLIFHPMPHLHVESPVDEHYIRIGGGILNAFQCLFSLRIQFCPSNKMREAEKTRLIEVFTNALSTGERVDANTLMKVPSL